jgi:hypothetical protein
MAQVDIRLNTFKVLEKNEWSKDEPYLWCFGLVIDANTIGGQTYIIKRKPDQGNLGGDFSKGESRAIPDEVGRITSTVTPLTFGSLSVALVGVLVLAWEEDRTPNSKVVQAYNDSATILTQHIADRIRTLNTGPLTQAEVNAIVSDLKSAITKRFKSAVHWYNPFSWDPDDFIGFAQMIEPTQPGQSLSKQINFTFSGDDAKYQVTGQLQFVA